MTIDEAIQHCEEKADSTDECILCREEHRQLSEWLKELKLAREEIVYLHDYIAKFTHCQNEEKEIIIAQRDAFQKLLAEREMLKIQPIVLEVTGEQCKMLIEQIEKGNKNE